MIDNLFELFVDAMMWGTVPLIIGLGYWERHLALNNSGHELAEIILVAGMFTWAYFWYCIEEYHSITHYLSKDESRSVDSYSKTVPFSHDSCNPPSVDECIPVIVKKAVTSENNRHVSTH